METVDEWLRMNYANRSLTIDEIAAVAGCRRTTFYNRFKTITGVSPVVYLARLRMSHAATLLAGTSLPVAEIAAAAGYDDFRYFSRVFKKHHGMTPSQYRIHNQKSE